MQIPEKLRQAFESAIILSSSGSPWEPSVLPCFVISACCPYSNTSPLHRFLGAPPHESLRRCLKELPGAVYEEVVGQSPDGSWQEPSWAVYGINEEQAIALGRIYLQWAIFRFDEAGRAVLAC